MRSVSKKQMALLFVVTMMLSLLPVMARPAAADDSALLLTAPATSITVTVNGESIKLSAWNDVYYVKNPVPISAPGMGPGAPSTLMEQTLNIYVPESATASSPVMLYVNNAGWQSNNNVAHFTGGEDVTQVAIGKALTSGYVVVTYNCRGRNDDPVGVDYLGHSPATMTDTKAVIRYLRLNKDVITGDTEKIVVTGTSGGGALSVITAASGNSPDYFPSLFEIGAAGMTDANTSTINDDVFATIAYCAITDMPHADLAYEWIYGPIRKMYKADGWTPPAGGGGPGGPATPDSLYGDNVLEASDELAAAYVTYFNGLGLKDTNGNALKADDGTFKAAIKSLLEKGVEKELTTDYPSTDAAPANGVYNWLNINAVTHKATIDWDTYLYWVGTQTALKTAPAFSNLGSANSAGQNEDSIFGTKAQAYSPFEFWSWNNREAGDPYGKNWKGETWEQFIATPDGEAQLLQMKMTNPIPYLLEDSKAGKSTSAQHWYVRHGMKDRDTSFPVEATLFFSLKAAGIKDVNFNFAWLKPHSGDYDVDEAYEWLAEVLGTAKPKSTGGGGDNGCSAGYGVFVLLAAGVGLAARKFRKAA